MAEIRVELPFHLRNLASTGSVVIVSVSGAVTQRAVLDALEVAYPMLRGTIRDQASGKRRPLLRYFACERDISHESPDQELPERVRLGFDAFLIVGSVAGG